MTETEPLDRWRTAVERVLPSVRADLERLVRIRSVSADPSASAALGQSAELIAGLLRDLGLADVEVLAVDGGQPAVIGQPSGDGWGADGAALRPPRRAADG